MPSAINSTMFSSPILVNIMLKKLEHIGTVPTGIEMDGFYKKEENHYETRL